MFELNIIPVESLSFMNFTWINRNLGLHKVIKVVNNKYLRVAMIFSVPLHKFCL